jgi:hypothetical protein
MECIDAICGSDVDRDLSSIDEIWQQANFRLTRTRTLKDAPSQQCAVSADETQGPPDHTANQRHRAIHLAFTRASASRSDLSSAVGRD